MEKEPEIWKTIREYTNLYEVSNWGRVRLLCDYIVIKNGIKIRKHTRMLRQSFRKYYRVSIESNTVLVHRLVATAFVENPNNKPNVNHKSGDKKDNYYKNLEWSTQKENIIHSKEVLGYNNSGENHYLSKLKTEQVIEIKILLSKKYNVRYIAEKLNIKQHFIYDIKSNRSWGHVNIHEN